MYTTQLRETYTCDFFDFGTIRRACQRFPSASTLVELRSGYEAIDSRSKDTVTISSGIVS